MYPDFMNFGLALVAMKVDKLCVARKGWNGKKMFIFYVPGSTFTVNRPPLLGIFKEGTEVTYRSYIDMRAADGTVGPWTCSQTDMQADDWYVVGEEECLLA